MPNHCGDGSLPGAARAGEPRIQINFTIRDFANGPRRSRLPTSVPVVQRPVQVIV